MAGVAHCSVTNLDFSDSITSTSTALLAIGTNENRMECESSSKHNYSTTSNVDSKESDLCGRLDETSEQAEIRLNRMRIAVRTLLECIGEDPNREGLLDTPSRFATALSSLTRGYCMDVNSIVHGALFHEGHGEMVVVRGIEINSLCEHHLLPFTGKMHIGYIPSDTVIGLSKLARIANIYAQRLQIQERLTKEVAQAVMKIVDPVGVAVVVEAEHMCMKIRGVEKVGASTNTLCALGCFEKDLNKRNEFLRLIAIGKS